MRIWAMRCGHGAFVMLACMYFMTDVVLLRVLGIVANALDMCYCFKVAATPLWLNIGWGGLYVAINVVQLYVLYSETASVDLDPEMRELHRAHFEAHGITQQQFRKLLTRAGKVTFRAGEAIQLEGQPATKLVLMASGGACISENGVQVAKVDSTFVGNMAFLAADAASAAPTYQATFIADTAVVAWVWKADDLRSLVETNPSLGLSVRAMLHDELLKFNQGALAYARVGSYKQLLRGVTVDGEVNAEERTFVEGFRRRVGLSDGEHVQCLKALGWSEAQWKCGKGPGINQL